MTPSTSSSSPSPYLVRIFTSPVPSRTVASSKLLSIASVPTFLPQMPLTGFPLIEAASVERFNKMRHVEMVIETNKQTREKYDLPNCLLKFSLLEFSAFLKTELSIFFKLPKDNINHPTKIWHVGRGGRNILNGLKFRDRDLRVYCQNKILNEECLKQTRGHRVFNELNDCINKFLNLQIKKSPFYPLIKTRITDELLQEMYTCEKLTFSDGSAWKIVIGEEGVGIDLTVFFNSTTPRSPSNIPKSLALSDGFHFDVTSTSPQIQCIKGLEWCGDYAAIEQGLYEVNHRLIRNPTLTGRKAIFRLVLEAQQGFITNRTNIDSSVNKIQDDFTNAHKLKLAFHSHQKHHCHNEVSLIFDFFTWLTFAEKKLEVCRLLSECTEESTHLDYSIETIRPVAGLFSRHREIINHFMPILRGLFLLKLSQKEEETKLKAEHATPISGFVFKFMEDISKPVPLFSIFHSDDEHFLYVDQDPLQILLDFINSYEYLVSMMSTRGGMAFFLPLIRFLDLNEDYFKKELVFTKSEIAREMLLTIDRPPIASILHNQYRNTLSKELFYQRLNDLMKGSSDYKIIQIRLAQTELAQCAKTSEDIPEVTEIASILRNDPSVEQWKILPEKLLTVLKCKLMLNPKWSQAFKNCIGQLLPQIIERAVKTLPLSLVSMESIFSLNSILLKEKILSKLDSNKLLFEMMEACATLATHSPKPEWLSKLIIHAFQQDYLSQSEISKTSRAIGLQAFKSLSVSTDPHVILLAQSLLDKILPLKTEFLPEIILILNLLRERSETILTDALAHQMGINFLGISQNHRELFDVLMKRGNNAFFISICKAILFIKNSKVQNMEHLRIACETFKSMVSIPGLILEEQKLNVFKQLLTNLPSDPISNLSLAMASIVLLKAETQIPCDEAIRASLLELGFRLLSTTKKAKDSEKIFSQVSEELIYELCQTKISHHEFREIKEKLLERCALEFIDNKKSLHSVSQPLYPTYLRIWKRLSNNLDALTIRKIDGILDLDVEHERTIAKEQFIAIVRQVNPAFITRKPFQSLFQQTRVEPPIDKTVEGKVELKVEKLNSSATMVSSRPVILKNKPTPLGLVNESISKFLAIKTQNSNSLLRSTFTQLCKNLNSLTQEEINGLKADQQKVLKASLLQALAFIIRSSYPNSHQDANKLMSILNTRRLIDPPMMNVFQLLLIQKFIFMSSVEDLSTLERLLTNFFKIKNSFESLNLYQYKMIISAYELLLKKSPSFNIEPIARGIEALCRPQTDFETAAKIKIVQLCFLFIQSCLTKKSDSAYSEAISILQLLINTHLIKHAYFPQEMLLIRLINEMPQSWKKGTHDERLDTLIETALKNELFKNLIHEMNKPLLNALKFCESPCLNRWSEAIKNTLPRPKRPYYQELIERTLSSCNGPDNLLEISQGAEVIFDQFDAIKPEFFSSSDKIFLYESLIKIFSLTKKVQYLVFACEKYMEYSGYLSSESFHNLLSGFPTIHRVHYKTTLFPLLKKIVHTYLNPDFLLDYAKPDVLKSKNLLLEILKLFYNPPKTALYEEVLELLPIVAERTSKFHSKTVHRLLFDLISRLKPKEITFDNVEVTKVLYLLAKKHMDKSEMPHPFMLEVKDFLQKTIFSVPIDSILGRSVKIVKEINLTILIKWMPVLVLECPAIVIMMTKDLTNLIDEKIKNYDELLDYGLAIFNSEAFNDTSSEINHALLALSVHDSAIAICTNFFKKLIFSYYTCNKETMVSRQPAIKTMLREMSMDNTSLHWKDIIIYASYHSIMLRYLCLSLLDGNSDFILALIQQRVDVLSKKGGSQQERLYNIQQSLGLTTELLVMYPYILIKLNSMLKFCPDYTIDIILDNLFSAMLEDPLLKNAEGPFPKLVGTATVELLKGRTFSEKITSESLAPFLDKFLFLTKRILNSLKEIELRFGLSKTELPSNFDRYLDCSVDRVSHTLMKANLSLLLEVASASIQKISEGIRLEQYNKELSSLRALLNK